MAKRAPMHDAEVGRSQDERQVDLRAMYSVWRGADTVLATLSHKLLKSPSENELEETLQDLLATIASAVARTPASTIELLALKMALWRMADPELVLDTITIDRAQLLAYSVFRDLVALSGEDRLLTTEDLTFGSKHGFQDDVDRHRACARVVAQHHRLQRASELELIHTLFKGLNDDLTSESSNNDMAAVREVLIAKMYDLAWKAAATPADSIAALRCKADILAKLAKNDATDLVGALAHSICSDVQTIAQIEATSSQARQS